MTQVIKCVNYEDKNNKKGLENMKIVAIRSEVIEPHLSKLVKKKLHISRLKDFKYFKKVRIKVFS